MRGIHLQKKRMYQGVLHSIACFPKDLRRQTVEAIGCYFAESKKGWLSNYHFRKEAFPADSTAMLGGSEGPSNSYNN